MVKDMWLNGTVLNTANYSAAIPLVGLYIAAASMVCFFLVLCDVWAGLRRRMYWFPCRFFSINSVTLTLISIAAKIPVDLTTSMPSKQDQLSKLSGSVFICAMMCFMLPSVATNAEFESYANVTALSIFLIIVVVNVCIQMATGVIFSFIVEHVIILVCLLILLMRFWFVVTSINAYKSDYNDVSKDLIRNGGRNMLARLKHSYLYSYHSSPQLYLCWPLGNMTSLYMICSIMLVQAMLRPFISKDLRSFEGKSDYGWSIWLVVVSQSLTLAIVTFAMGGRWLINITHLPNNLRVTGSDELYLQIQYLFSLGNLPSFVEKSFRFLIYLPVYLANWAFAIFDRLMQLLPFIVCLILSRSHDTMGENPKEFTDLLSPHHVIVHDWVLQRGMADMKRWMETDEKVSPKHLNNLLSAVAPSEESSYKVGPEGEGIKISLLSMMLLVEMAKLLVTPISLTNVLDEVFEILLFIDDKVNTGNSKDRLNSMLAKVIHQYGLTTGLAEFALERKCDLVNHKVDFIFISKPVCGICQTNDPVSDCIREATCQVSDFINYRSEESSEVVYSRIKQLFVDMLHAFLAQLPVAVFTHILESPAEEHQERLRLCLGFFIELQSIESPTRFSLPDGSNITSLFHTQNPAVTTPLENSQLPMNIVSAVQVFSEIQEDGQAIWEEV